jgi:predicted nucleic acid-binding protein
VERVPDVTEYLLDSWPLLEWMKGREPAASQFEKFVNDALSGKIKLSISRMNYGEVLYSIAKDFAVSERARRLEDARNLPLTIYSINDGLLDEAVALKSVYSISYADCFCAAQAMRLGVPVVTGDPEFRILEADGLLKLHWIGR